MKGQVYINDKDIYTIWGAVLVKGAYESLLKPAPNKQIIENKSRLEHGKKIVTNSDISKIDERDVTISFWIIGTSQYDYLSKYRSFIEEITSGLINLKIPILYTTYRLAYLNCTAFGDYGLNKGKLTVKFNEPNPANRDL